jgi:hypothetical protein
MADTQEAPHPAIQPLPLEPGSTREAQEALLGILDSLEDKPKSEEAAPTEEEESTEETQDESLEEESEEESETSDEEETEEDEEEESEESDEDEDEEEPLFTVMANGKEEEVTYDELIKGYSRQSDYTRKTQELSNLRQEYERGAQQYAEALPELQNLKQQYSQALGNVISNSVAGLERFNIDWNALREEDREEYLVKRAEFQDAKDQIRGFQERKAQEDHAMQEESQRNYRNMVAQEHQRMVEQLPEWADQEERTKISADIKNYATSKGFTNDELSVLSDHRYLLTLMKAMKYDSLQSSDIKSKKLKNKPKVVRSGKGREKSQTDRKAKAAKMRRLQESGHVRDATSLFEDFVEL